MSLCIRATLALAILLPVVAAAQGTAAATLYGYIFDPTHRAIPGARIVVDDPNTDASRTTSTNQQGFYSAPALSPGPYNITVEANGFKTVHQNDVVLGAEQQARLDVTLKVGGTTESITVEGSAPLLNTSDATVSTLIGNQFVTNMPLNGRTFSTLINLTPGVVLPQTNFYDQGQFSVNGQRPDANYFTVDGVSANLGTSASNLGQGGSGQLPVTNAFGGMSNLVSMDALQEFRIQTSTFAPEYGRTPGGQVSVVTKSGTNDFHGTAFEYFRNDVLDANNWFSNNAGLPRAELRQNDFGGVLGGRIKENKLFFFASYEGLIVRQPQVANTYEPTLATIRSAPAVVQPLLKAFPKPNGKDFGNGTAQFIGDYSDPSSMNAGSIRVDYLPTQKTTIFGRYNYAPSNLDQRSGISTQQWNYNTVSRTTYLTETLTLGSNQSLTLHLTNEVRFNYSRSRSHLWFVLDNFGGAIPPPQPVLLSGGRSFQDSSFSFFGDFNPYGLKYTDGELGKNVIDQINVTDAVSYTVSAHRLKFGLDYRRLRPEENTQPYAVQYIFLNLSNVLANTVPEAFVASRFPSTLVFSNWSLYAQDTWNARTNLTITYGLRWDYNSSPSSPNGTLPYTVDQVNNLKTMTLVPAGTPLWDTQKDNFAPRLGVAWSPRSDLVIRAGAGIFYDLGYASAANGSGGFPYAQGSPIFGASFPLSAANLAPPPFTTSPPVGALSVVDPNHHVLPRTYEWNAALEQGFGNNDVLTLTYIGAAGRKLMRRDIYFAPNPDFTGEFDVLRNAADSSYNALQVQYRHRLTHGLQALASYTWSHSIDDVSSDANFLNTPPGSSAVPERGSSDYDIRNTFAGAVSYSIRGPKQGWAKPILENWSVNTIVYARSAPPVNVVTGNNPFPGTLLSGAMSVQRPNVVPGVPFYLSDPTAPAGKVINKAAFTVPASGQGNLGRNALRAFNAFQVDFTLQRLFKLTERFSLKTSADFFNIFNHPNFGAPINYMTSPQFGFSTQTLNSWLGSGGQSGGLNPLYQIGGPRSIQLALKLQF